MTVLLVDTYSIETYIGDHVVLYAHERTEVSAHTDHLNLSQSFLFISVHMHVSSNEVNKTDTAHYWI